MSFDNAKIAAIKETLKHFLKYEDEELNEL